MTRTTAGQGQGPSRLEHDGIDDLWTLKDYIDTCPVRRLRGREAASTKDQGPTTGTAPRPRQQSMTATVGLNQPGQFRISGLPSILCHAARPQSYRNKLHAWRRGERKGDHAFGGSSQPANSTDSKARRGTVEESRSRSPPARGLAWTLDLWTCVGHARHLAQLATDAQLVPSWPGLRPSLAHCDGMFTLRRVIRHGLNTYVPVGSEPEEPVA